MWKQGGGTSDPTPQTPTTPLESFVYSLGHYSMSMTI